MRGGEKMNISKVYYEELRSKCVGGKWESVRIGAVTTMENNEMGYRTTEALLMAKDFVRESLNKEMGYDTDKNKETKKLIEQINKEVREILTML